MKGKVLRPTAKGKGPHFNPTSRWPGIWRAQAVWQALRMPRTSSAVQGFSASPWCRNPNPKEPKPIRTCQGPKVWPPHTLEGSGDESWSIWRALLSCPPNRSQTEASGFPSFSKHMGHNQKLVLQKPTHALRELVQLFTI